MNQPILLGMNSALDLPTRVQITTNERGKIIRTTAAVRPKMKIRTRVSEGEFGSEVV